MERAATFLIRALPSVRAAIALTVGSIVACLTCLGPTDAAAQGAPRVVTMQSGAQYEGLIGSINEMYPGTLVADPYEAKPIVVINDGLRRVFVPKRRVQGRLGDSNRNEISLPVFQRTSNAGAGLAGGLIYTGPFNEKGHRQLQLRNAKGATQTVIQGITSVSPRLCVLETLIGSKRQWSMRVGTGTIPNDILLPLLRRQIKDPADLSAHEKIADWLIQAGYYQLASEELRLIGERFPDDESLQADVERNRRLLKQQAARQIMAEARLRMASGQTKLAELFLSNGINTEGVAGEILAEFRELQTQRSSEEAELTRTKKQLQQSIDRFTTDESVKPLSQKQSVTAKTLSAEIERDLNPVNAPRLADWQRLLSDKDSTPRQHLARAISGWLLGSNNSLNNLAVAESLFEVRDLVREYLNTAAEQANRRSQILQQIESLEGGTPPLLAAMIAQLLPVDPPPPEALSGIEPIRFEVTIPGTKVNPQPIQAECLALVPPQYDPYRRYPLLLSLPGRQTPAEELNVWCGRYNPKLGVRTGPAIRNGYIVVTVDWKQRPNQREYKYSGYEHAVVLRAMRAALRKFAVDSDRVFLVGRGIGADGAYDIGLSHPEHWAGVIGIAGKIDRYAAQYAGNKHRSLPVYCATGERDVLSVGTSRGTWNKWLSSQSYVNCTVVNYIGRANDFLPEEITQVFDWTKLHRRRWPGGGGFKFDVRSLRPWDNYFWFLEVTIPPGNIMYPEQWRDRGYDSMKIKGSVSPERTNLFRLEPVSAKGPATLWLEPNYVDFTKRIEISGMGRRDFRGFVEPSRQVLLEDVRTRCDRQRPYHAKIVLDRNEWKVPE